MNHQSSMYAISQFKYSESLIRKIFWLLFLLFGVIVCSYQISKFLKVYLTYPVVISLEEEPKSALDFPAITICNINRMKERFTHCKNTDIAESGCVKTRVAIRQRKPSVSGIKPSERRYLLSCKDWSNGILKDARKNLASFMKKYMRMGFKNQQAVGHKVQDLIKYCSFNGYACSSENFTLFQSLKYGNCYTFNKFKQNHENLLQISSVGYNSGLELVLNVEMNEYAKITPSIGVHVLIHDPHENPVPDERGAFISPGFEASIALKQVTMHRLPSPYRDQCRDYRSASVQKSEDECLRNCFQQNNYKVCGCVDPTMASTLNETVCDINNEKDVCCLDQTQDEIVQDDPLCDCPLACFSKYYEQQLSKAIWPSKEFIGFKRGLTPKQDLTFFRKNSIRLKIYYLSLMSKEFRQVPMFDSSEMFGNLGGQFELWIEFSLFAFFELMEIVICACHYTIFHKFAK